MYIYLLFIDTIRPIDKYQHSTIKYYINNTKMLELESGNKQKKYTYIYNRIR